MGYVDQNVRSRPQNLPTGHRTPATDVQAWRALADGLNCPCAAGSARRWRNRAGIGACREQQRHSAYPYARSWLDQRLWYTPLLTCVFRSICVLGGTSHRCVCLFVGLWHTQAQMGFRCCTGCALTKSAPRLRASGLSPAGQCRNLRWQGAHFDHPSSSGCVSCSAACALVCG